LFKPSKDGKTLVVCNKKIAPVLDVVFFAHVYTMEVCLCISGLHSDEVTILWEPIKRGDFVAQSFI